MSESLHSDKLPQGEEPQIRVMAMPADTNASGDIFGGWLMSQVDIAGSIAAYRRARGRIVTIAVNEFRFLKPVNVGDLVSLLFNLLSGELTLRFVLKFTIVAAVAGAIFGYYLWLMKQDDEALRR